MNWEPRDTSSRVAYLVSRYTNPSELLSDCDQPTVLSSNCLVIWHAVEPNPITRAGEATLGVVLAMDILERTPARMSDVTINSPDKPIEAGRKDIMKYYDNYGNLVPCVSTEISMLFYLIDGIRCNHSLTGHII